MEHSGLNPGFLEGNGPFSEKGHLWMGDGALLETELSGGEGGEAEAACVTVSEDGPRSISHL